MTPTLPRRRWFRFSLATMFAVVTFRAVLGWLAWNVKQVRERAAMRPSLVGIDEITFSSGEFSHTNHIYLAQEHYQSSHKAATSLRDARHSDSEQSTDELPRLWTYLGASPEEVLYLREDNMSNGQIARIRSLFPESEIWVMPQGLNVYINFERLPAGGSKSPQEK